MIVAIHQPNFLPWLGFFKKIISSDTFVVLDHVQNNPRDSQSWLRRVKLLVNKQPTWVSVSLDKNIEGIGVPLNQMKIKPDPKQVAKQLRSIEQSYGKHNFFEQVFPLIEDYYSFQSYNLATQNIAFIESVLNNLGTKPKMVYSSDLSCQSSSTELLVEILVKLGGETYLSGDGAGGYQNEALFNEADILLRFNNFQHPEYPQKKSVEFTPGLSIVDALMNIGFDGVRELLTKEPQT